MRRVMRRTCVLSLVLTVFFKVVVDVSVLGARELHGGPVESFFAEPNKYFAVLTLGVQRWVTPVVEVCTKGEVVWHKQDASFVARSSADWLEVRVIDVVV